MVETVLTSLLLRRNAVQRNPFEALVRAHAQLFEANATLRLRCGALHAQAQLQRRGRRLPRRARRLPVLCALAARRRRPEATATSARDPPAEPPTARLVSICLRLATLGTTRDGACDGALWRLVVAFV